MKCSKPKENEMKRFLVTASILTALMLSTALHSHADAYVMHILRGGDVSFGRDINDSGQIVGTTHTFDPYIIRAVLWNSYWSDPQSLDEGNSRATAQLINNSGLVIGDHESPPGFTRPFRWSATTGVTNIDVSFYLESVNESGTIVGWKATPDVRQVPVVVSNTGQLTYLDNTCGGIGGQARDINDSGYVVGDSRGPDSSGGHASIWYEGDAVDIGTFGGTWSVAKAINNFGQVVGVYGDDNGAIGNFVWSLNNDTIFIPTCSLFDYGGFGPIDINDNGVVLGNTEINGVRTVLTWSMAGGFTIVGTGDPHAINNSGYIVGTLEESYGPGPSQAVVWEPVPEPSSLLALAVGLVPLILRRRR